MKAGEILPDRLAAQTRKGASTVPSVSGSAVPRTEIAAVARRKASAGVRLSRQPKRPASLLPSAPFGALLPSCFEGRFLAKLGRQGVARTRRRGCLTILIMKTVRASPCAPVSAFWGDYSVLMVRSAPLWRASRTMGAWCHPSRRGEDAAPQDEGILAEAERAQRKCFSAASCRSRLPVRRSR